VVEAELIRRRVVQQELCVGKMKGETGKVVCHRGEGGREELVGIADLSYRHQLRS
jgi:hypothetical protein